MAELYVSDAFGTVHRAHASTAGVAAYLPAVSGFLIQKELAVHGRRAGRIPSAPSWPSWAAPRSPTRSASSTTCWTRPTPSSSAAAWPIPSPPPRAARSASPCCEDDKLDYCQGDDRKRPQEKGVKLLLPVDTVCADGLRRRRRAARWSSTDGHPRRLAGPGHRPGDRAAVLRRRRRRGHRGLERPHGRV